MRTSAHGAWAQHASHDVTRAWLCRVCIFQLLKRCALRLQVVPWGDLDSLAMLSRQMDVDGAPTRRSRDEHAHAKPYASCAPSLTRWRRVRAVLITGHTHEFKAYKYEDRLFINPVRYTKRHTHARDDMRARADGVSVWLCVRCRAPPRGRTRRCAPLCGRRSC